MRLQGGIAKFHYSGFSRGVTLICGGPLVLADHRIQPMEVVSLEQAHEVAWIRNQCRGKFTHHNEHITGEQQRAWWESQPDVRMWLYTQASSDITRFIGFGLLRPDEHGHVWATLAVLPGLRGQGYGTAIYRHLVEQGNHVWIEIAEGNPASYRAARKAGFVTVDVKSKVLTMVAGK